MSNDVKFKLSDLPPHLRMQAERQIANVRNPKLKTPPKPAPKKASPIRVPKVRQPNKTEARYVEDHPGQWQYEALSFSCPSGKYTPDWVKFDAAGHITAVEVKGSYEFASQAAAAAKFKECVALFPHVTWIWAKLVGKSWTCGTYNPPRP